MKPQMLYLDDVRDPPGVYTRAYEVTVVCSFVANVRQHLLSGHE